MQVSSGSYCSSCPEGCGSCQSGSCLECLPNFELVDATCRDIASSCQSLPNCKECSAKGSLACSRCFYPYYLEGGACVRGSSLLCGEGAVGPLYLQCHRSCMSTTYVLTSLAEGVVCQPRLWLPNYQQLYFTPYDPLFADYPTITLAERLILQDPISRSLSFPISLPPYYKLGLLFKVVLLNASQAVTISCELTDSGSVREGFSLAAGGGEYEVVYFNFTTRNIKEQTVEVVLNDSQQSLALSELLVQVYPCPSGCRLCFNGELCKECLPALFVSTDYRCVSSCVGSLELYLPSGDADNFSSKSCVLECPAQYYAETSGQTRCLACSSPCKTCLSQWQCLSCLSPLLYYEIELACLPSCPATHFAAGDSCSPCNAPCATCVSAT